MTGPGNRRPDNAGSRLFFSFGMAAIGWVLGSIFICRGIYKGSDFGIALPWMLAFNLISLVDLLASSRLIAHLLSLHSESVNRTFSVLRASYWASIKIACLFIFGVTLLKGRLLPLFGLLLGASTLLVVPVLGGILWYCMGNRNEFENDDSSFPGSLPSSLPGHLKVSHKG